MVKRDFCVGFDFESFESRQIGCNWSEHNIRVFVLFAMFNYYFIQIESVSEFFGIFLDSKVFMMVYKPFDCIEILICVLNKTFDNLDWKPRIHSFPWTNKCFTERLNLCITRLLSFTPWHRTSCRLPVYP